MAISSVVAQGINLYEELKIIKVCYGNSHERLPKSVYEEDIEGKI